MFPGFDIPFAFHSWFKSESEEKNGETTDGATETTMDDISKFEIADADKPEQPDRFEDLKEPGSNTVDDLITSVESRIESLSEYSAKLREWKLAQALKELDVKIYPEDQVKEFLDAKIEQLKDERKSQRQKANRCALSLFALGAITLLGWIIAVGWIIAGGQAAIQTEPAIISWARGIPMLSMLLMVLGAAAMLTLNPDLIPGMRTLPRRYPEMLEHYIRDGDVPHVVKRVREALPDAQIVIVGIRGAPEKFAKVRVKKNRKPERYVAAWREEEE